MSIVIECDGCGRRLRLPATLRGRKTKCPHCGGVTTGAAAGARKQAVPAKPADEPEVTDDLDTTCPQCNAAMTADAVLCVECGYNARTGKILKTVVKRYKRHWESDFPLVARALLCLLTVIVGMPLFGFLAIRFNPLLFLLMIPWAAAAVLNFGDFRSVDVERTRKGKLLVTAYSHVAFVPAGSRTVDAARCNAIVLDYSAHLNYAVITVFIVFCLLAPPLAVIRLIRLLSRVNSQQETFRLLLRGVHRRDDLLVYKGRSQAKMSEIVDAIREVTNLSLERR